MSNLDPAALAEGVRAILRYWARRPSDRKAADRVSETDQRMAEYAEWCEAWAEAFRILERDGGISTLDMVDALVAFVETTDLIVGRGSSSAMLAVSIVCLARHPGQSTMDAH